MCVNPIWRSAFLRSLGASSRRNHQCFFLIRMLSDSFGSMMRHERTSQRSSVGSSRRTSASFTFVVSILVVNVLISVVNAQLHFSSIGNWGTGSTTQYTCAKTLNARALQQPITYMVSPGSNFIGGVEGLNDTKWTTAFAKPFAHKTLKVPFLTVLGSEDWKANYTAQLMRTNVTYGSGINEAAATTDMPIWTLPNAWYSISQHFTDSSGTFSLRPRVILLSKITL